MIALRLHLFEIAVLISTMASPSGSILDTVNNVRLNLIEDIAELESELKKAISNANVGPEAPSSHIDELFAVIANYLEFERKTEASLAKLDSLEEKLRK